VIDADDAAYSDAFDLDDEVGCGVTVGIGVDKVAIAPDFVRACGCCRSR